ncbi:hypothetical protein F511_27511 [Dorcoceras hygrometricum]|uniref:Uncharacterized protein n=1 Tax=Dorcoceras hygrometricum TaxID=472368 RepID=A0A2Z7D6B0_9LAMI|nr:hypothetical protein F511_27511 [Dorcoceras hygrometricum]
MVIGSLETLDLSMVVDLIGIYVLKGPYCTLAMTNWFLQALSVIPRGSWGDVARRFTMIRWASPKMLFRSHTCCGSTASYVNAIVSNERSGSASVRRKQMSRWSTVVLTAGLLMHSEERSGSSHRWIERSGVAWPAMSASVALWGEIWLSDATSCLCNPELALEWKHKATGVRSFLEKSVCVFSCWFKLRGEHFSLN